MTASALKASQFRILNRHLSSPSALRLSLRLEKNCFRNPRLDFFTLAPQHQLHWRARNVSNTYTNTSSLASLPSSLTSRRDKHLPAYNSRGTQEAHTVILQSAVGSWTLAAIVVVGSAIYALVGYTTTPEQSHQDIEELPQATDDIEEKIRKMSGEILPGRPGTLTAEEDEKLRQFWIATHNILGILETPADTPAPSIRSDTISSKKDSKDDPKKKRKSLFSRNKESKETASPAAGADSSVDDKYGQTKEFHDALANMSQETIREHFWAMMKQDNPDAFLLRFLRARKWDVEKALVMMVSTIRWRAQDVHVDDDIMLNGEMGALENSKSSDPAKKKMGDDFMTQLRLGKSFIHGLDKTGRPMCFVRVRLHKAGEQSEESMERYTVFVIESARLLLNPPVDTACVVFDMTGFSLANMDYAPVKFMIKCFEANYPESLGVVLVHKAPWIFQGIWKIIRGWLDPVVASKIQFTSDYAALTEYIAPNHIPTDLGGAEPWEYKYIEPQAGENAAMKDTATRDNIVAEHEELVRQYEKQTMKWINGDAEAKLRRAEMVGELKASYWRLDPYIRAKTLYDREGTIGKEGLVRFYPGEGPAATNGAAGKPVETSEVDLD